MPALRRLTIDDYDAVIALWQRSGLQTVKLTGRDSRSEFEKQLQHGQIVIGLEDGDKLIGVVVATNDTRKGWINRIAIDPEYRRRGYGEELVHAAEAALSELGLKIMAALIEDYNKASLALFNKLGYGPHPEVHYVSKRESSSA
jgi:ribosomal protein S18 acetylase RimI-like enzyme